ncbi:MAG: ThuA domain-containing protein [Actinomycetota bacterium]
MTDTGPAGSPQRVLVVTKGHPFEAEPFFAVFDDLGLDWRGVEHPEAAEVLNRAGTADVDALVMYDMPGITFTRSDPPATFELPSEAFRDGYRELLIEGRGLVFLHHAIASWPAWPQFARWLGGRFHYQPGSFAGTDWPDSGYVHEVTHTVEVLAPEHAVCAGVEPRFTITDELYLFPVAEGDVVPLLRSTHRFTDDGFYSADRAIRGTRNSREGWRHPPGSDLVGWVTNAENSPIVYLQFGDGPTTYADPTFRRLVGNAVDWVASDDAHRWARARNA